VFFSPATLGLFVYVILLLVAVIIIFLIYKLLKKVGSYEEVFATTLFKITIQKNPKSEDHKDNKNWTELLGLAEGLFSTIGGLKQSFIVDRFLRRHNKFISFEIVAQNGLINFYFAVPKSLQTFLIQQIHAQYPHAQIQKIDDYNLFKPHSEVGGGFFIFKKHPAFPIRTYRHMENDPLNTVLNSLSKLETSEGVAIQLLVTPVSSTWRQQGREIVKKLQNNEPLSNLPGTDFFEIIVNSVFKFIYKGLGTPKLEKNKEEKPKIISPQQQKTIESIEEKLSKGALAANLRVIVSTDNKEKTQSYLNNITNAFSQYSIYEYSNGFKPAFLLWHGKLIRNFIYRLFDYKKKIILNTEELASLWHLPNEYNEIPNLEWLGAKRFSSPENLPLTGTIIGLNEYRGQSTPVRIKTDDRRRHTYIIGQTGTGKTTLMKSLMVQDIVAGNGCCIIDPHGDFAQDILKNVPPARYQDVIYIDPTDTARPIGINMLEYNSPEQKTFVVNELLSIFDKLYDLKATGGPMFEQYMRNATQLVMDDPDSGNTLLEIPKVLSDEKFRKYKLSKCQNPTVIDFWEKEAQQAGGEAALANMVPYITSKLTPFLANDILRPIVAQQHSSFDFREAMDSSKIIIVNLSKGKLGDINSKLLGMIIVGKILIAGLSRVNIPENERKDFYLYIDEFQNFTTDSISIILAEARKYRLNLIIANQYLGQLVKRGDSDIRDAVFGNVGTFIAFRIGVEDAEFIAKQFKPIFNENDLINIPKYSAYIKLLIDNTLTPAFNIITSPEPVGEEENRLRSVEYSRLTYGRPLETISREIMDRTKNKY
jgi:hypothetical protein